MELNSDRKSLPQSNTTELTTSTLDTPPAARYPGYAYAEPMPVEAAGISEYVRVLKKHKYVILGCVALSIMGAALYSAWSVRVYQAVGKLAIYRENSGSLGLKNGDYGDADWDDNLDIDTQVKIIQSDSVAMDVIKKLRLYADPRFVGPAAAKAAQARGGAEGHADIDSDQLPGLLGSMHGGMQVASIPRTRIVEIRFSSQDPKLASEIVNATAAAYIEQNFKTRYDSTMQTSEWLSRQLADLQVRVETAQQKLVDYQKQYGILGLDDKQDITTAKLTDLNKQLTEAEGDRIQKEANYRLAASGNADLVARNASSTVDKYRDQIGELQEQLARLSTQYGPSHPKVEELRNQIQQVQASERNEIARLAEGYRKEYLVAAERERLLRQALDHQKEEANKLNEHAIEFNLLKRDVDTSRQLYESLLQKLKEAGVTASLRSSSVRVVDAARVPTAPIRPNVPRNLQFGFVFGMLGGIAVAFVLEAVDTTVRTPEHVEMVGMSTLAVIPLARDSQFLLPRGPKLLRGGGSKKDRHIPEGITPAIFTLHKPQSQVAEAYRALRTSILLSRAGAPPKVLLVSSCLPKEGKTTTAANIATVLVQQGARVLLIDADLRRPAVHRITGAQSTAGLTAILAGTASVSDVMVPSPISPGLFVIPAGSPAPHPAELLTSRRMQMLLDETRNEFDHIVIDTPPALSVTDPVALSVMADGVLLIARSGVTTKHALRSAVELFTGVNARILGVVINAANLESPDYHYYYEYSARSTRYYRD